MEKTDNHSTVLIAEDGQRYIAVVQNGLGHTVKQLTLPTTRDHAYAMAREWRNI